VWREERGVVAWKVFTVIVAVAVAVAVVKGLLVYFLSSLCLVGEGLPP